MPKVILLGLMIGLTACGGGGGGDAVDARGANVDAATGCVPGSAFNLTGRMGVDATLNVHVTALSIVNSETTADLLVLLDNTQTGQNVGLTATVCDLQIPQVPVIGTPMPIVLTLDPTVLDSVAALSGSATVSGTTTCANFTSQTSTLILGCKLDPITAPLPVADANGNFSNICSPEACAEATTTNCACDQEGDGKPGVTLSAQNVPLVMLDKVYVSVRATFSLAGKVFSSDRIDGTVAPTLEVGILGCNKASGPCTSDEVKVVNSLDPMIVQSTLVSSTFRAVRVDSALTCAQLRAMRDTLFPR